MISVLNRKHHPTYWAEQSAAYYIGRPSPLGNPFKIGPDGDRDAVIERYRLWLTEVLYFKDWWAQNPSAESDFLPEYVERMTAAYTEFDRLCAKYKREGTLKLMCWCSPLPCHGDVIANFIESRL